MKATDKYLDIHKAMMFEYLQKISLNPNTSFDEEKMQVLRAERSELSKEFQSEYENDLIDLIDNEKRLRAYLMRLYVSGFKYIVCMLEGNQMKQNSTVDNDLDNFIHSVALICRDIKDYLKLNLNIQFSEIDCNKYVLGSNKYFGDFEIESLENRTLENFKSPIVKKAGRNIKRRSFTELIINEKEYKEKYIKELRGQFKNQFNTYNGVKLAKLAKSLEALNFFKSNYNENLTELYDAFRDELGNHSTNNVRGFSEAMKEKESDKEIIKILKQIGFDKLDNLKP